MHKGGRGGTYKRENGNKVPFDFWVSLEEVDVHAENPSNEGEGEENKRDP